MYHWRAENLFMRAAQIARDNSDVEQLKQFLDIHSLLRLTDNLQSISGDIVEALELICHMARDKEREIESIKTLRSEVSFTRKDKVRSLASLSTSIEVRGNHVDVDSLTIFQRLCIIKQCDDEY